MSQPSFEKPPRGTRLQTLRMKDSPDRPSAFFLGEEWNPHTEASAARECVRPSLLDRFRVSSIWLRLFLLIFPCWF